MILTPTDGRYIWISTTAILGEPFEFETVQTNPKGEIIHREIKTAQYFRENLGNDIFIDMLIIPGGTFRDVPMPPFFMSKTPITQAQWNVVKELPKIKIDLPESPFRFKGPKRPVEQVNWWQAEEFCKRLANVTRRNYRLPSETEWEYACRSGTTTSYYFGETLTQEVANYDSLETTNVAQYFANAWGLYDMHGNVWEWCSDHWRSDFETVLHDSNPFISNDKDPYRVIRGGAWSLDSLDCQSNSRIGATPEIDLLYFLDDLGFRLACSSTLTIPSD